MSTNDIHDMISTAMAGDGDRLLDICMALLDQIKELNAKVARLEAEQTNPVTL